VHTELRKVTCHASRRGYNQPFGQGCAACPMHRRRARGTRHQCSETAYDIRRVSLSVLSSGLARVEIHALQREFALCVQPERQPHHRPNYIVAPCVFISASCLAMQCFLKYLFHFPQGIFQLSTGSGVKVRVREIMGGSVAECDRLKSLETNIYVGPKCFLRQVSQV
jgi:hypothetical protein